VTSYQHALRLVASAVVMDAHCFDGRAVVFFHFPFVSHPVRCFNILELLFCFRGHGAPLLAQSLADRAECDPRVVFNDLRPAEPAEFEEGADLFQQSNRCTQTGLSVSSEDNISAQAARRK
jgi:hypothetical protein